MPWIRMDCSTLDDDFTIDLSGDEFKAWTLFLLRVKGVGARGSVPITSMASLSRNWKVSPEAIKSMLAKAGDKITEESGRWYVKNWRKYQEDYRDKSAYPEIPVKPGDGADATTLQDRTLQDTTETKEKKPRPKVKEFVPPTVPDVIAYFAENGFPEALARRAHKHYDVADWHDAQGHKVKNWKQKMISVWFKEENRDGKSGRRAPPVDTMKEMERMRDEEREKRRKLVEGT